MEFNLVQQIAIWALPVIFAITVHEAAHGWMANRLGDATAREQGRLTLNPIKHIDPVGTVLVPLAMMVLTSFVFGWAKPVPVNYQRLRNPQRDMVWVALAGPASNFVMAIFWALMMKAGLMLLSSYPWLATPLVLMGEAGILINLILMVLNLLPIPPLDGGRIVTGLLPPSLAQGYARIEPYGLIILVVLLVTGVLGQLLFPIIITLRNLLRGLAGL